MSDQLLWWAYRHINGGIHVKPYFPAENRAEAEAKAKDRLSLSLDDTPQE
ncbi:MAG: hypothetical protein XU15_C0011G0059 [candidate division NC10 bacterium CSP1-5]|nr:MAG: hypothetical protein XU15_C0011G0059 [candidate division NC10 bacterium CSP1-5]